MGVDLLLSCNVGFGQDFRVREVYCICDKAFQAGRDISTSKYEKACLKNVQECSSFSGYSAKARVEINASARISLMKQY
ncbi:hypothetical protein DTO271D3_5235 [Paecilomyces variotii]|nr:hypothetical protein DTO271D3_5235 [Paecilomyces variotii]